MHTHLRSFRLVCAPEHRTDVERLLRAEDYAFTSLSFLSWGRSLTREPRSLGQSLAARFGCLYIQDKSSMLPPLALNPPPGATVLDMCASPGSKTSLLADLVGAEGLVIGNEPSPDRLATLRANIRHLGYPNIVTTRYMGQDLPLPSESFSYILLDAPCSGWGTVNKNPQATKMWAEGKTQTLEMLQRELLCKAQDLLAPGGHLVYSTCTTNPKENEEQIQFACTELGLRLDPLLEFSGFSYHSSLPGCLLVNGNQGDAQGFFLARLTRPGSNSQPGQKHTHSLPGESISAAQFYAQTGLCRPQQLPKHHFLSAGGRLYLLYDKACHFLPKDIRWQGFCVGKSAKNALVPDLGLRLFVPPQPDQHAIILEEVPPLAGILSGQSLPSRGKKRVPLYFQNLPLGFLAVKGTRCLWNAR